MRKQKSEFSIKPEEELDLQHQGSLGGEQLRGRYGRAVSEASISSLGEQSKEELKSTRKPGGKPDVAMSSSSEVHREQERPELKSAQGPAQEKSSKKHHYK